MRAKANRETTGNFEIYAGKFEEEEKTEEEQATQAESKEVPNGGGRRPQVTEMMARIADNERKTLVDWEQRNKRRLEEEASSLGKEVDRLKSESDQVKTRNCENTTSF